MSDESPEPVLQVAGLSFRYPNGCQALEDITFNIAANETVGLVGPSGAGKSTLLMHLNGLLPGKESANGALAKIHVNGLPVSNDHLPEIRRLVGFLFQDPDDQLFCPTVREDVAFGPLNLGLDHKDVERRVTESLTAVGLEGFEFRSTLHLSVGERKRVCLASVLACEPSLLALDEPSGNLDPRARRTLLSILKTFTGGQIIATHDLDLVVEHCQRVLVLDEGEIQAVGTPEVVLADKTLMDRHGLDVPLSIQLRQATARSGHVV